MRDIRGRIHSIETCGTVDGPGIRFVLFMQGCMLRCVYCHNPDTWQADGGREVSSAYVLEEIAKYRSYMKFSGGGVTISGGEPLLQPRFLDAILAGCTDMGLHSAVDTSGCVETSCALAVLEKADMVLLDIKCMDPYTHRLITGFDVDLPMALARGLDARKKTVWLRHVLVPELTDKDAFLHELGRFAASLSNVERLDILPYHTMGRYKWDQLGLAYELEGISAPSADRIENAHRLLASYGVNVV